MRSASEVSLAVQLDGQTGTLPRRLAAELRRLIGAGVLLPGDPLPSSRAFAAHLAISRGSVVAAYDQLLGEGYLTAAAGGTTRVNSALHRVHPMRARVLPAPPAPIRSAPVIDLRPGLPAQGDIVSAAWRAAWRRAADAPVGVAVPHLGWPELRAQVADHVRVMRGVIVPAGQVAITSGAREGLALLLTALAEMLGRRPLVGVEDPGYPSLRLVPQRLGCEVIGLVTDAHGLVVDRLPETGRVPDAVIVTPSHQYPLGGSLPMDRRQALLAWAREYRVWIVEDDYDSELRYTSEPLPALLTLDEGVSDTVVLLGTFSKTLSPALAAGFLLLPTRLVAPVEGARADLGQPVSLVTQRAVANYLASGAIRRHIQRMRRRYARRRMQVVSALAGIGVRVSPMDGGLHCVVETHRPEEEVLSELAGRGVLVVPLSAYWAGRGPRPGIVFGFGSPSDEELARGLSVLRDVLAAEPMPAQARSFASHTAAAVSGVSGSSPTRT